ncbi:hypothetical protein KFU94_53920 [Chloroflexi bacterium TSY]|nr:hypothetical protein [Chloroflexi bacterium TSY]
MNIHIRNAVTADLPRLVVLAEERRIAYQEYQPIFWRKSQISAEVHTSFLENQLNEGKQIALVYEEDDVIRGFVIADARRGDECSIDDFCVAVQEDWTTVGRALLVEAGRVAQSQGASRYIVVCGHLDQPKRSMLREGGLTIEREWFTGEIKPGADREQDGAVRPANQEDISQIIELSGQKRADVGELSNDLALVLVYERNDTIEGYAIALLVPAPPVYDPGGLTCLVAELAVADSNDWETRGGALLAAAGQMAQTREAIQYVVVCDHVDAPKRSSLHKFGLTIASEWYGGEIP